MNKKLFTLLVILMSLSLIGIIFVQAYYINNSLETKEEQFTFNVKKALTYTTNQVAILSIKNMSRHSIKLFLKGKSRTLLPFVILPFTSKTITPIKLLFTIPEFSKRTLKCPHLLISILTV